MMKLLVCGTNASYAHMPEVLPTQLDLNQLYIVLMEVMNDEGEATRTTDTCWIRQGTSKNLNGSWKKMIVFAGSTQPYFISQLPICRFFGPLKMEIEE